jgi:hypothetical protein
MLMLWYPNFIGHQHVSTKIKPRFSYLLVIITNLYMLSFYEGVTVCITISVYVGYYELKQQNHACILYIARCFCEEKQILLLVRI